MARPGSLGLVIAGALLLVPASLAGQTVGTSSASIIGTVRDGSGAVLPGVTVVLSSPAVMGVPQVVTTDEGFYRFPMLPPGEYSLLFEREGFRAVRREGILLSVTFTATVDVALTVAARELTLVEHRSPLLDRRSTAIVTNFDARQLADNPGSRSMLAILAATPAVQVGRIEVGGGSGAFGGAYSAYGTSGANWPLVEGISVSGIAPTGFALNYGSFEQVSVGTGAHGAEWPLPGVQMQFISKSGGDQYRGGVYADYEHGAWQSFNIDRDQILLGAQGAAGRSPREANRVSSYYDVNADVGGYIKKDSLWWYSSLRHQEVSARQVNLPVAPYRTRLSNYSGKGTYQLTPGNRLVAYGQVGRNHQPTRLDPFGPAGSGINATTVINEFVDATTDHVAWGWVWKGEWSSVVRSNLLIELRAGQFGARRSETPNGTGDRFEDVATFIARGGNRDWQREFRRNQLVGSLSYYKDDWFGSHNVKLGGQNVQVTEAETWRSSYPRNVLHVVRRGQPLEVFLFDSTPSTSASGLWFPAAYVTDSWTVDHRLTLNVGLRFDRFQVFLPEQQHTGSSGKPLTFAAVDNVLARNMVTPRIGAAYDAAGDGTTILKFHYGKYGFGPGTEVGFNANPNASLWWQRYPWVDENGNGVWDPEEEDRTTVRESRGGIELESLDPELELPFLTEVAGWVEHELVPAIALRTGVVWRGERQHYLRQNVNQPFDAFSVPVSIRDTGPDGFLDTPDDGPAIAGHELRPDLVGPTPKYVVRNVPNADTSHLTWGMVATRRLRGRWSLSAGFAHTWSRDHANQYSGQLVRQNMYPLNPNDLINAGEDGRYDLRSWSANIQGTVEGPWGLRVTPLLRHQSGQPFGRTMVATLNYGSVRILTEPIGTRRMDHLTILDVRIEKEFRLGAARRVAGFVDVFNLFNANPEQSANWSSTNFLRPIVIVAPRIARIGVKVDW